MKKLSPKAELKRLQKIWYKKLERAGFDDIEQDELFFKVGSKGVIDKRRVTWEIQAEYYQMASDFLNVYDFASRTKSFA